MWCRKPQTYVEKKTASCRVKFSSSWPPFTWSSNSPGLKQICSLTLHIPCPLYIHFYFLYSEIPPLSSESFSPSAPLCHSLSLTVCCLDCFFLHLLSSVIYEHIDAIWWTLRSGVIHGTVAQEH